MYLYQNSVLKMILESRSFFDVYPELTAGNPVLKAHVESIDTPIVELKKFKVIQETDIRGIYIAKKKAKNELAELIYPSTGALRSFAVDNNNPTLFAEVRLSVSVIKGMADVDVITYSTLVTDLLTQYLNELKEYGIDQAEVEEILAKTKEFQKLMLLPAKARQDVASATENIKSIISEILMTFNVSIDNDMLQYYGTELYQTYTKRRQIDDSPTRHLPLFGRVLDEETKEALQFVAVTIVRFKAGPDFANTVKTTTKLGNYRFKDLEPDVYKVIFSLHAYDTLEIVIALHAGESRRLNVELRKKE